MKHRSLVSESTMVYSSCCFAALRSTALVWPHPIAPWLLNNRCTLGVTVAFSRHRRIHPITILAGTHAPAEHSASPLWRWLADLEHYEVFPLPLGRAAVVALRARRVGVISERRRVLPGAQRDGRGGRGQIGGRTAPHAAGSQSACYGTETPSYRCGARLCNIAFKLCAWC